MYIYMYRIAYWFMKIKHIYEWRSKLETCGVWEYGNGLIVVEAHFAKANLIEYLAKLFTSTLVLPWF